MSLNTIRRLAYRCYKILPLVYDESLSYYEVICKCAQKLNEVIDSMDEMVTEFNSWEEQIAEIESSFDTIEATLALHNTQISGLQGDISELEQTVESLANSITSLTSQISTLGSTVAGIQSDIAEIDSDISALETNVDDLQNDKMNKVNPTGTGALSMNRKGQTHVGTQSVAIGNSTEASGNYSTAEGNQTKATSAHAHAEGDHTHANAQGAHAEGYYTVANGEYQHVAGKYNKANSAALRITGNGTANTEAARANAELLDASGNLFLAGNVYVECNAGSTGGKKISTAIYRHVILLRTQNLAGTKGQINVAFPIYTNTNTRPTKAEMLSILNSAARTMVSGKFTTSNEMITEVSIASSTINVTYLDAATSILTSIQYNYTVSESEIEQTYYDVMPD